MLRIFWLIQFVTCCSLNIGWADEGQPRTSVVEGRISEMVPSKKEIYVRNDEGKYEFYFSSRTTITEELSPRSYSDLSEGQRVRVTSRVVGKRLDPLNVEILSR